MVEVPTTALIIGYSDIFGESVLRLREKRLDLIRHIPKEALIHELASLNYRLRPYNSFSYSISFEKQKGELLYFCGGTKILYFTYLNKVLSIAEQLGLTEDQAILFNRPANLFALQEVIHYGSDLPVDGFNMWAVWDDILRYYLAVNDVVSDVKPEEGTNFSLIERSAAGHLFLNNLQVVNNPFLNFERFIDIVEYFKESSQYSRYFADYFRPAGFDPETYLYALGALYTNLKGKDVYYGYLFDVPPEFKQDLKILNLLSHRETYQQRHDFDLTDIKKYPFYKISDSRFILLDMGFLIDKSYQLFINDFFFDYLQPNGFAYDSYASHIGLFFETYVSNVLKKAFEETEFIVKTLEELKTSATGSEIELADFYVREDKKIMIGQVKASGLNNDQNRGMAASLFSGDKNFYKDFGLIQIVKSLEYLNSMPQEFDSQIPAPKLEVYPVIVLNDTLCSTPAMPMLFHEKLRQLLKRESFHNLNVKPIALVHIQELELLGYNIKYNGINLWQVLASNYEQALFPKPFKATLARFGVDESHYKYSVDRLAKHMGLK